MSTESQILLPPTPPSAAEERQANIPIRIRGLNPAYKPGEFLYVNILGTREMLSTAYKAINLLEFWEMIKESPGENGFIFSTDNRVLTIYNKIEALGYSGHSGCSFGFTMRTMQLIAKEGEEKYRLEWIKTKSINTNI
jgi:hypothetical protein